MVLIFLRTGDCVEVEAAVSANSIAGYVLCFDRDGKEVANFLAEDVEAFTKSPETARLLEDEICDDISVIPEEASPA